MTTATPSGSTAHFGFTKLVVADLDAAAAFYATVFGLAETARVSAEIAGRPIDEIMYAATGAGGATFVLLRFADQPTPAHDEVILGFIVSEIGARRAGGGRGRRDRPSPDRQGRARHARRLHH